MEAVREIMRLWAKGGLMFEGPHASRERGGGISRRTYHASRINEGNAMQQSWWQYWQMC